MSIVGGFCKYFHCFAPWEKAAYVPNMLYMQSWKKTTRGGSQGSEHHPLLLSSVVWLDLRLYFAFLQQEDQCPRLCPCHGMMFLVLQPPSWEKTSSCPANGAAWEEPTGPCVYEAPARQFHHPLQLWKGGKLRHGLGMGTGVKRGVLSHSINRWASTLVDSHRDSASLTELNKQQGTGEWKAKRSKSTFPFIRECGRQRAGREENGLKWSIQPEITGDPPLSIWSACQILGWIIKQLLNPRTACLPLPPCSWQPVLK